MAPHSSTLAWKIPWMEEPGRPQSMGSLRVGNDWATSHFHFSLSCIGEGNDNPLQCSCLENPRDRGAWWAAVCGVTQSWTRLKWLSSSSRFLLWKFSNLYKITRFDTIISSIKTASFNMSVHHHICSIHTSCCSVAQVICRSIHDAANAIISFFLYGSEVVFYCIYFNCKYI